MDTENITCTINGTSQTLRRGTTLLEFLKMKGLSPQAVVVEHNRKVIPRGTYEEVEIHEGDVLEIVQIIGGG